MRLEVHDNCPAISAGTESEVDAILASAAEEARAVGRLNLITMVAENGNSLSLVVGGKESVLGFTASSRKPPYYGSKGIEMAEEPVLTAYLGLKHHSEFPRYRVIPFAMAIAAAHDFLATGLLPKGISWTEI
jgi:Immunity protein Imm1